MCRGDQGRQALSEGHCRTHRSPTAKAAEVEQETNRLTAERQITRLSRGGAVNAGRGSPTLRAGSARRRSKCRYLEALGSEGDLSDRDLGNE